MVRVQGEKDKYLLLDVSYVTSRTHRPAIGRIFFYVLDGQFVAPPRTAHPTHICANDSRGAAHVNF